MSRIPTVARLKRDLNFRSNVLGDHAATVMRQAMIYAETKQVGASLRRYCAVGFNGQPPIDFDPHYPRKRSDRITIALEIMDRAFETYGVEYLREIDDTLCERGAEYLNTGDTYACTVLYDRVTGSWRVTSWGDFVEACERRGRRFE